MRLVSVFWLTKTWSHLASESDQIRLSDVCPFFLSAPFPSRSVDVRLCFQKKSLKKRGPAPYETPRWTVFWLRPDPADPRSLALSSSCACGATCPAVTVAGNNKKFRGIFTEYTVFTLIYKGNPFINGFTSNKSIVPRRQMS